jgi:hypothetical protein
MLPSWKFSIFRPSLTLRQKISHNYDEKERVIKKKITLNVQVDNLIGYSRMEEDSCEVGEKTRWIPGQKKEIMNILDRRQWLYRWSNNYNNMHMY